MKKKGKRGESKKVRMKLTQLACFKRKQEIFLRKVIIGCHICDRDKGSGQNGKKSFYRHKCALLATCRDSTVPERSCFGKPAIVCRALRKIAITILLLESPCSFVGSSGTKFAAPGVLDASGVLDAA